MLSAYYNREALIGHQEMMRYKLIQIEDTEKKKVNVTVIIPSAVKP